MRKSNRRARLIEGIVGNKRSKLEQEYADRADLRRFKYPIKRKHGGLRSLEKKGRFLVASDGAKYVRYKGSLRRVKK